jgi:outer membrane protein assembly factor BamA
MFALAAIPMAGQTATSIHLEDIRFTGGTRLDGVNLEQCATVLKSQIYVGTELTDYFVASVRTRCLLDKGYFKAAVKASSEQLPDDHGTRQFVITFDVDASPRYRLGLITFKNNRAISNAKALRRLFPIKDGDILDHIAIAKGPENLRRTRRL